MLLAQSGAIENNRLMTAAAHPLQKRRS